MKTTSELTQNVIPAEQALVRERQVTVQCLNIGTKQVTQSLYRQLVEEDVIDWETGKLKGDVWGWVNLHDDMCSWKSDGHRVISNDHIHAVWEDKGLLKRSFTYKSYKILHDQTGIIALKGKTNG